MRIGNVAVVSLVCALTAMAQDKITVPLTNPSQPATIQAKFVTGSIKVIVGTGRDVIVTTSDSAAGRRAPKEAAPPGMRRIDMHPGLSIEEDHNVVTIKGGPADAGEITIETPVNTNLQLKTVNGSSIEVTGVNGDHEIENTNGSITLTNVSGSVVAHTTNGGVTVSLDHVTGNKPMSFASLNGKVEVSLPADTKAQLRLRSDNGSIFSDFDIKLEDASKPTVEDSRAKNGKYRISVDKTVTGTINGGGPEFTFRTMNGDILIHKK